MTQNRKQPKCHSTNEWISKLWYVYMMEYYTGVRFTIDANRKTHEFEDAYK